MTETIFSEAMQYAMGGQHAIPNICNIKNVSKKYRLGKTSITALDDLSMTVSEGEFGVIMGPSGSGKSTLLNIIGCIETASSGDVQVLGREVAGLDDRAMTKLRRDYIGFIFQSFSLIPVLTAAENVEYPLMLSNMTAKGRKKRVADLLAAVGLSDRADHRPGELSGGQRQRVAIARALVKRPKLVIGDEPTANVDSTTAHELMQVMTHIQQEFGSTFLIATHDPRVMEYASRRWTITDGSITNEESI